MGTGVDTERRIELSAVTCNQTVGACAPGCSRFGDMASFDKLEPLLDANVFAARRGCASESLETLCAARRIFAVVIDGVPRYPSFYVDARLHQRQVEAITKLLGGVSSGGKLQFFVTPKGSLGAITPLDALMLGRFNDVRAAAIGFAER